MMGNTTHGYVVQSKETLMTDMLDMLKDEIASLGVEFESELDYSLELCDTITNVCNAKTDDMGHDKIVY